MDILRVLLYNIHKRENRCGMKSKSTVHTVLGGYI